MFLVGAAVVVVVVLAGLGVSLEGVEGGKGEGAGEGLGEAPRSDRPKILEEALPIEAAGELGFELEPACSLSDWLRPCCEDEADDLVRPEPNTLRNCEAMFAAVGVPRCQRIPNQPREQRKGGEWQRQREGTMVEGG